MSMDVDVESPTVIPGTPNLDEYAASLGDADSLAGGGASSSRGITPAFPEHASRSGSEGVISRSNSYNNGHAGNNPLLAVPSVAYEMDLDNNDDDQQSENGQPLVAHRLERASSTSSSVNLKASTRSTGKRKHGGGASTTADSRGQSPASTPAPTDDSSTLAAAPVLVPTTVPGFFTTRNHPMNKASFRYVACGPVPGTPDGLRLMRIIPSPPAGTVRFSWEDRSSYVNVSADGLAITTDKGFRSARANVPMREGAWYFEIIVEKGAGDPDGYTKGDAFGPHVRLGIARREAPLNAPVGYDGYSYGIRDKTGDKVHISQTRQFGETFGTGDVIGVYVYLPPRPTPTITAAQPEFAKDPSDPARIVRKRVPIRYKGQLYFESMEYAQSKEMEDLSLKTKDPAGWLKAKNATEAALKVKLAAPPPGRRRAPPPPIPPPPRPLPRLTGSKIAFFKNGECLGLAYEDLFDWLPLRQQVKHKPATSRQSVASQIAMARENFHDDGSLGYYPMASVFGGGIARINAGPDFKYPPPQDIEGSVAAKSGFTLQDESTPWKPLSDLYEEYYQEQRRLDEIDESITIAMFNRNQEIAAAQAQVQAQQRLQQQQQQQRQQQATSQFQPQQQQQIPYQYQMQQQQQYQQQYQQQQASQMQNQQTPVSLPSTFLPGHFSNSPSPSPKPNQFSEGNLAIPLATTTTKRKTGLSNELELIPTYDSTASSPPVPDGDGNASAMPIAEVGSPASAELYIKQEDDEADGDASPDPEFEHSKQEETSSVIDMH